MFPEQPKMVITRKGKKTEITIEHLQVGDSHTISKAQQRVKRTTNTADKIARGLMETALNNIIALQTISDTRIVQNNPKRVGIYVLSKMSSVLVTSIATINSTTYLKKLLEKLEDPQPENALEIEAREFVKARLEEKEDELLKIPEAKAQEKFNKKIVLR